MVLQGHVGSLLKELKKIRKESIDLISVNSRIVLTGKQAFERFPRQRLKPRKAGEGRRKEHRVVLFSTVGIISTRGAS